MILHFHQQHIYSQCTFRRIDTTCPLSFVPWFILAKAKKRHTIVPKLEGQFFSKEPKSESSNKCSHLGHFSQVFPLILIASAFQCHKECIKRSNACLDGIEAKVGAINFNKKNGCFVKTIHLHESTK
jgi:hypothetical protein